MSRVNTLCFSLLFLSLLAYADSDLLLIDWSSHFRILYCTSGVVLLFLSLLVGIRGRFSLLAVGLATIVVVSNGIVLWPYLVGVSGAVKSVEASQALDGPSGIRVMTANVNTNNDRYEEFVRMVKEQNPDHLLVLEVDQDWEKSLSSLRSSYPYGGSIARADNFGIALFSKHRLIDLSIEPLEPQLPDVVVADVQDARGSYRLIGLHTLPPVLPDLLFVRNAELGLSAKLARENSGPVIVLGDLNTTMWSQAYRKFLDASGLIDSRLGHGLLPTWPFPLAVVPIDHVLVSKHWAVLDLDTVMIPGSDHRALVAHLLRR